LTRPATGKKPLKAPGAECCAALQLVLSRWNPADKAGLTRETTFSFTGSPRDVLLCRVRKAPRGDKSEFANATFAELRFCPFCGVKVNGAAPRKRGTRRG
jgi:hypothetical protein